MPTPDVIPSVPVRDLALGDLEPELAATRRVLERVPADRYAWKPHEKSMSLGGLARHLAELPVLGVAVLDDDAFDLAATPSYDRVPESAEALLRMFDDHAAALRDAFARTDEARLTALWTVRYGGHDVARMPRAAALRNLYLSHTIHHRAQLGVYLRLLDVPLPFIYGPTADEKSA